MVFLLCCRGGGATGQAIPQCGYKLGKNMQVLSTRLMERGALGEWRSRRGVQCEVAAAVATKVADECEWDCNKANDPPVWTTRPWRDALGNRLQEIPGADKQPFVALPTNHPSSLPSLPSSPPHSPNSPSSKSHGSFPFFFRAQDGRMWAKTNCQFVEDVPCLQM